jgi:hypothetical protein
MARNNVELNPEELADIVYKLYDEIIGTGYQTESIEVGNLPVGVSKYSFTLDNKYERTSAWAVAVVENVPDSVRVGIRDGAEMVIERTNYKVFNSPALPIREWKPVDLRINKELFIEIEAQAAVTNFKIDVVFALHKQ